MRGCFLSLNSDALKRQNFCRRRRTSLACRHEKENNKTNAFIMKCRYICWPALPCFIPLSPAGKPSAGLYYLRSSDCKMKESGTAAPCWTQENMADFPPQRAGVFHYHWKSRQTGIYLKWLQERKSSGTRATVAILSFRQ